MLLPDTQIQYLVYAVVLLSSPAGQPGKFFQKKRGSRDSGRGHRSSKGREERHSFPLGKGGVPL